MHPRCTPDAPGCTPDAPGCTPDAPQMHPDAPQMHLVAPQMHPDAPRCAPDAPGCTPDAPGCTPDAPRCRIEQAARGGGLPEGRGGGRLPRFPRVRRLRLLHRRLARHARGAAPFLGYQSIHLGQSKVPRAARSAVLRPGPSRSVLAARRLAIEQTPVLRHPRICRKSTNKSDFGAQ